MIYLYLPKRGALNKFGESISEESEEILIIVKPVIICTSGDFNDGPDALEGACQLRIATYESERKQRRDAARQRQKEFKVRL